MRLLSKSIWAIALCISDCMQNTVFWTSATCMAYSKASAPLYHRNFFSYSALRVCSCERLFKEENFINKAVIKRVLGLCCCHGQWEPLLAADSQRPPFVAKPSGSERGTRFWKELLLKYVLLSLAGLFPFLVVFRRQVSSHSPPQWHFPHVSGRVCDVFWQAGN